MSRGKNALGIAVLFALALSAFSAGSASAKGTTAYTCVQDPNGDLTGAHCLTSGGGEKYKHVAINQDETTTVTATNANTAEETKAAKSVTIRASLASVNTEITCSGVHGEGTLENKVTGGEMFLHSIGQLHFTGCVVKAPAGKGCKVSGETITTNQMTSTSAGLEDAVKVGPQEGGGKIAEIKIEGCSIEALNNTFPLTGSVKAFGPGATLTTTHAQVTTENTLKFGGQKAGFECAVTIKGHSKAGEETKPISVTTEP